MNNPHGKHKARFDLPYNPESNQFDAGIERLWQSAGFGDGLSAEVIAKECGVTRQAIKNRERVILKKISNQLSDKDKAELAEYL
jgi:hypothetical protein